MNKKKLFFIFIVAFVLNLIWENLHSYLYVHYQGGVITEFILLRATFADAVIITFIALPFLFLSTFKKRAWLMVPIGVIIAVSMEWYALGTGRWAYNALMPIIPLLKVGLTPAIQLGLLGYLSYSFTEFALH